MGGVTPKPRPKTTARTKVDPSLKRQLESAPADGSVGAVFTLKTPPGEAYRAAPSARQAMEKIVDDVAAEANVQPARVTMFPNVQSFAVYGPPALVRKLAAHPEVASAIANKQDQDMLIRPVERKAVVKRAKKKR